MMIQNVLKTYITYLKSYLSNYAGFQIWDTELNKKK